MFIEDNDCVEIKLFYKKQGKGTFNVLDEEEHNKLENKTGFTELNVKMKVITWGLHNDLNDKAYVLDMATNERKFSYKIFKEQKLISLISGWDATRKLPDGKVVPVPANKENILKLAPDIAEQLLMKYDELYTLTEEEEKK